MSKLTYRVNNALLIHTALSIVFVGLWSLHSMDQALALLAGGNLMAVNLWVMFRATFKIFLPGQGMSILKSAIILVVKTLSLLLISYLMIVQWHLDPLFFGLAAVFVVIGFGLYISLTVDTNSEVCT
ncbi:MAG: hypothetical protein KDD48_04965 [Bdellovibrionales bacterium]|nr:hypothetical protein [Bdellovibrionales bacterium]